jgi:hypothetical protein
MFLIIVIVALFVSIAILTFGLKLIFKEDKVGLGIFEFAIGV